MEREREREIKEPSRLLNPILFLLLMLHYMSKYFTTSQVRDIPTSGPVNNDTVPINLRKLRLLTLNLISPSPLILYPIDFCNMEDCSVWLYIFFS